MSFYDRLWAVLQETREGAATHVRIALADSFEVAPFDDRGIAEPGKEKGAGFAILIGEWRIGWWETRSEACQVRDSLTEAVKKYPILVPPAS